MRSLLPLLLVLTAAQLTASGQQFNDYDQPPFNYFTAELHDPFTKLQQQVAAGKVQLAGGSPPAFLRSLLKELNIPATSQALVYSKTAFQRRIVNPDNLRAMYFNEDVFLTYIPGGRIEVASNDPTLGNIFTIFDPTGGPGLPKLERMDNCLGCHGGSFTNFLPGPMVRSVLTDSTGRTVQDVSDNSRGHGVPLKERWGGWIVTHAPASLVHSGNIIAQPGPDGIVHCRDRFSTSENVAAEALKFDLPAGTSDVAALLVLDHQIGAMNALIEAGYRYRHAIHTLQQKQKKNGENPTTLLTGDQLEMATNQATLVARQLAFHGEAPLGKDPITTDSAFVREFTARGARTKDGQSLREFDLTTRLFKNRLSYMIDSNAFTGLPEDFRAMVWGVLKAGLTAEPAPPDFAHWEKDEKMRILKILRETRKDLPAGF